MLLINDTRRRPRAENNLNATDTAMSSRPVGQLSSACISRLRPNNPRATRLPITSVRDQR